MEIKKNITENLFCVFFSLCAVMLTENALLRISDNHSPVAVVITSIIFISITLFIFINRKKAAVYIGAAILIILIFLSFYATGFSAAAFIHKTAVHFFTGLTLKKSEIILVTSIMSMFLSALLFPLLRIRTARYIISVSVIAMLVCYGICKFKADFVESFSAAGIILSSLAELCLCILYPKKPLKQLGGILAFLLPLFTLFSLSVAIIPSSEKPISWKFIEVAADKIGSSFSSIFSGIKFGLHPEKSEFSISLQGYSDSDDIFGGGISDNDQSQLKLSFYSKPHSSLYLTGNVSDKYTGKGWTRSSDISFPENDFYLDYCETMLAFERMGFTRNDIYDCTKTSFVSIMYDDIDTITLFYPLKTKNISASASYDASLPSIVWKRIAKSTNECRINFFEIDYHSEKFKSTAMSKFSYENDNHVYSYKLIDTDISKDIMDILSKRCKYIEDTYTKLPDFITERTYCLADAITENCDSNYEKLCAIEEYLHQYTYTKTPGPVPKGYDPVDYFLFESCTGYCTYFASSMAVLARCEGIPTRYVQGFAVDRNNIKSLKDNPVYSAQAHAWVEAYIEGVGWIPFEPTASLNQFRYKFESDPVIKFNPNGFGGFTPPENNDPGNINIPTPHNLENPETQSNNWPYIIISAVLLVTIVLLILIYAAIRIRSFIVKYKSSTSTEKFITCYRMIIYLFERNKHKRKEEETIDRFIAELSDELYNEKAALCQVTSVFDRIRYGEGVASDEEIKLCEQHLRDMFIKLKNKHGKAAAFKAFAKYCLTH